MSLSFSCVLFVVMCVHVYVFKRILKIKLEDNFTKSTNDFYILTLSGRDFFPLKISSFYQFIESDSKCLDKNFRVFKETLFLVCYTKSQFASRAFNVWSNFHFFCATISTSSACSIDRQMHYTIQLKNTVWQC